MPPMTAVDNQRRPHRQFDDQSLKVGLASWQGFVSMRLAGEIDIGPQCSNASDVVLFATSSRRPLNQAHPEIDVL